MSRSYTFCPPSAFVAFSGTVLAFFNVCVGQLIVKIHILFQEDISWTVAHSQMKSDAVKDRGHVCKLIQSLFCSIKAINDEKFYVRTNAQSLCIESVILCSVIS
jgi:hypothetical protein